MGSSVSICILVSFEGWAWEAWDSWGALGEVEVSIDSQLEGFTPPKPLYCILPGFGLAAETETIIYHNSRACCLQSLAP